MQDKEFDQLFRDRFEEAEVTPSLNLWANIEEKLVVKRKRVLPVYWSAAAAVLVAVTLALLLKQPDKIQLGAKLTAAKKIVMDTAENAVEQQVAIQPVVNKNNGTENKRAIEILAKVSADHQTNAVTDSAAAPVMVKKDLIAMQPSAHISHPDNKEAVVKREIAKLPAVSLPLEEVVLASADIAKNEEESENKQAEEGKIRNVGDLVNFVVDKVDKREEKFIQFKTDDDNSSLISLNIGLFRFNQKKHK